MIHVTVRLLTDECYTLGYLTDQWYMLLSVLKPMNGTCYCQCANRWMVHTTVSALTDECYTLGYLNDEWYMLLSVL